MIKVSISKKNDLIDTISIKGHSGYDESGKDIVCASVSSIVITSANAIIRFDEEAINYVHNDGLINLEIVKHSNITDTLILNMLCLLDELAENYSKYIKIMK